MYIAVLPNAARDAARWVGKHGESAGAFQPLAAFSMPAPLRA